MDEFITKFKNVVDLYPDNNAVSSYEDHQTTINLTYRELNIHSLSIKAWLKKYVDTQNDCIGLIMEHNIILPSVIIGTLRSGFNFTCIDPYENVVDISNFIQHLQLKWIIKPKNSNKLTNTVYCSTLILLKVELEMWSVCNQKNENVFKDICYVIRTSGTTGEPKIVRVTCFSVFSNIYQLKDMFRTDDTDVIYFGTPLTFDPSMIELFLALISGACLLIVPNTVKLNPSLLLQVLFRSGVTFLQMPPSLFLRWSDEDLQNVVFGKNSSLKILALGGEIFPVKILSFYNPDIRVFNLYGITEVSCWAMIEEFSPNTDVTLGKAMDFTFLEVRDENSKVVDDGEGELFIGSDKRICYINEENSSVVPVFRATGDIVKKSGDRYQYLGRKNSIIKRFGIKISLNRIEKIVSTHTRLTTACVWNETKLKLILYIVLNQNDEYLKRKILDKLRIKLLHLLPKECSPDEIVIIPALPVTNHGKVDRNSLLNFAHPSKQYSAVELFQNLWNKYLGLDIKEAQRKTFLECGGNSIIAVQFLTEFEQRLGVPFPTALIEMLLSKKLAYNDFINFIENEFSDTKYSTLSNLDTNAVNTGNNSHFNNKYRMRIKWKHNLEACIDTSAVLFKHLRLEERIAVGSHSQIFVVLDLLGNVICKTTLPDAIEGSACISPCCTKAVIGCHDGNVYCISVEDGRVQWKFETSSGVKCTPCLSADKKCVIFGSYNGYLYCVTLKDGQLVWKTNLSASIASNPILNATNKSIYIATIHGRCFCINKYGETVWKYDAKFPIFGSPVFFNNEHIVWANVKGGLCCLNLRNGEEVWTFRAEGNIFSSVVVEDESLMFGCHDGNIYCLGFTNNSVQLKYKTDIQFQTSTSPFICNVHDQKCFVACNNKGSVFIGDLDSGEIQTTFVLPGEIFSSPVVFRNKVLVGCRDNNFYCIDIEK